MAANRTRLCAFCAKRDNITGVVTDQNVDDVELVETEPDDSGDEETE